MCNTCSCPHVSFNLDDMTCKMNNAVCFTCTKPEEAVDSDLYSVTMCVLSSVCYIFMPLNSELFLFRVVFVMVTYKLKY